MPITFTQERRIDQQNSSQQVATVFYKGNSVKKLAVTAFLNLIAHAQHIAISFTSEQSVSQNI